MVFHGKGEARKTARKRRESDKIGYLSNWIEARGKHGKMEICGEIAARNGGVLSLASH